MLEEQKKGMTVIIKTGTRLTGWFFFLYGIHIISHGHLNPGGGFAGGVIITLSFIQLMLAYGKETALKKFPEGITAFFEELGALILLGIALLGFTGGYFFMNFISKGQPFKLFSAGIIPLCNIAIGLKVGAGIFAIFVVLVLLKSESEKKK